jgi:hypothetical protein
MQLKMGYVAGMQLPVTVDLKAIQTLIDGLLQEFEFQIRPEPKPYKLIRKASGEEIPDVARLSSGEAELFSLAVDVLGSLNLKIRQRIFRGASAQFHFLGRREPD